jgi:hypothetical protein
MDFVDVIVTASMGLAAVTVGSAIADVLGGRYSDTPRTDAQGGAPESLSSEEAKAEQRALTLSHSLLRMRQMKPAEIWNLSRDLRRDLPMEVHILHPTEVSEPTVDWASRAPELVLEHVREAYTTLLSNLASETHAEAVQVSREALEAALGQVERISSYRSPATVSGQDREVLMEDWRNRLAHLADEQLTDVSYRLQILPMQNWRSSG